MKRDPEWDDHEWEIRQRVYDNAPDFIKAIIDDTQGGTTVDFIDARLREFFLSECRVPTTFATADEFAGLVVTPEHVFGLDGPHAYNDGLYPLFIVVCPSYLATVSEGWDEADVNLMIEIVCFIGSELLLGWAHESDPAVRLRNAEDKLFGHGPETARVLKLMGLRAMELADG